MTRRRHIDDPDFVKSVLDAIEAGATPEVALRAHGINPRSWLEWRTKAREGHEKFQAFIDLIDKAEATSEMRDVFATQHAAQRTSEITYECTECGESIDFKRLKGFADAQKAFTDAAKVAIERLSRRFPRRWAAVSRIQVEDEQRDFLDRLEGLLAPEVYRMVLEAYIAATSGAEARESAERPELH